MLGKNKLADGLRETLAKAGFATTDQYELYSIVFDVIARRDDTLLLLKVLTNVDAFTKEGGAKLRTLAKLLGGKALLIGDRSGAGELEDGVLYIRHGVTMLSPETLRDYIEGGTPPYVYAAPGGLYARIDGAALKRYRQEGGLSLGEFADMLGVSRKAIQLYEEGMGATVDIASKVEEFLSADAILPLDPFSKTSFDNLDDLVGREEIPEERPHDHVQRVLERDVFLQLNELGYNVFPMTKCPFNALTKDAGNKSVIITGVYKFDQQITKRARVVGNISRVTSRESVLFVEKASTNNLEGTPVISVLELKKMREPEDVIEKMHERRKE